MIKLVLRSFIGIDKNLVSCIIEDIDLMGNIVGILPESRLGIFSATNSISLIR